MRTLIFEGIATSGKSTVIKRLAETLKPCAKIRVAYEDETHVPIMEARSEPHVEFFEQLLERLVSDSPDVIILDRLYMTQAYRAKCDLSVYKELEEFLLQFNPTTIFLKIDEDAIVERIRVATKHRHPEWTEYVNARGNEHQIANYYINQQRSQIELLKKSILPYRIFDTTPHNYIDVIRTVMDIVK